MAYVINISKISLLSLAACQWDFSVSVVKLSWSWSGDSKEAPIVSQFPKQSGWNSCIPILTGAALPQ
jgi:hypothetical protein